MASATQDLLSSWHLDNPLNVFLLLAILFLGLPLIRMPDTTVLSSAEQPSKPDSSFTWRPARHPASDASVWRTWTKRELVGYHGDKTRDDVKEDGRILFAIRRKVYDVSAGASFYGPGGPYANFAGRDASRGLAKQSFDLDMLTPIEEPIDNLADLTESEWTNLKDWESHFGTKYMLVGDYTE